MPRTRAIPISIFTDNVTLDNAVEGDRISFASKVIRPAVPRLLREIETSVNEQTFKLDLNLSSVAEEMCVTGGQRWNAKGETFPRSRGRENRV